MLTCDYIGQNCYVLPQKTSDPRSIFDKFVKQNSDYAKKVQEAGDKLGLGNYLKTPWNIVDTNPIYDQPGIIPNQTDPKLSVPRTYSELSSKVGDERMKQVAYS